MSVVIGIRREDKNEWERRVPLTPQDAEGLATRHDLRFLVQPSSIRIYTDDDFRRRGIEVAEDLGPARLILAVKEIPPALVSAGTTYVTFAHVIKGQPGNMPMLRQFLAIGSSLIDYERIVDESGRRLIFFGRHAGHAGMIETLWCLGKRLAAQGLVTPFDEVRHAFEYGSLDDAKTHLREIGRAIEERGLADRLHPLSIGIAGYGNVSQGCQEVLGCLPVTEIPVAELPMRSRRGQAGSPPLLKVVFKEEDMAEPVDSAHGFELQDYYQHPDRYRGSFARHLPHLDVLVNTIYWDSRYPRLVTRDWARDTFGAGRDARLRVIGDISCDLEGSVELTLRTTVPDSPCYVYEPETDSIRMGVEGAGPVIMAVDNLPCEFARESSDHFSAVLREIVPALAAADWSEDLERLDLPPYLKQAVIVHGGELTPPYGHLRQFLD